MEAGCLEWCVVIGLILRDANVIKQVISFLDSPEVPPETSQSLRNGLLAIDAWASTDWWVFIQRLHLADLVCYIFHILTHHNYKLQSILRSFTQMRV